MMNIFNITFLILLFTKSSVECGTTYHVHRITRHSSHRFLRSLVKNSSPTVSTSTKLSNSVKLSNSTKLSTSDETAQFVPCNTFKCLIEKYEVMKTPTGFLLRSLPESQHVIDNCTNLSCWLKRFKISQTSYGYQLTNKAVIEVTSKSPASTSTPLSTMNSFSTTKSTLQPKLKELVMPLSSTNPLSKSKLFLQPNSNEAKSTVASIEEFEEMFGDYFY